MDKLYQNLGISLRRQAKGGGHQDLRVRACDPERPRGHALLSGEFSNGRDDRIRTYDPHTPSVVRYQTAPRPDPVEGGRIGTSALKRKRVDCSLIAPLMASAGHCWPLLLVARATP